MADARENGDRPLWRKVVAIVSVVVGGIMLVAGGQNFVIRAVGLALVLFAVSDHRNGRRLSGLPVPSKGLWISAIVSAVLLLLAFQLLYQDALNGYHQVWPVYFFALVGVAATGIWASLAARLHG